MFLRSLQDRTTTRRVDGYFARAALPAEMGRDVVKAVFLPALCKILQTTGLGRVTGLHTETDEDGTPTRFLIALSLVTDTPRALNHLANALERLGAPTGSTIGNAECPALVRFGKPFGPGHYPAASDCGATVGLAGAELGRSSQAEFTLDSDRVSRMQEAIALASSDQQAPQPHAKRLH